MGARGKWLAEEREHGDRDLENPLGEVQMGPDLRDRKDRAASRILWQPPAIFANIAAWQ